MDSTRTHYDCLIAGAGPAGIFAALELVRRNGSSVLLLEQGPDIDRRACPARSTGVCAGCSPCDVTCGWGGAGAFSDGKLTLSPEVGGWLGEFVPDDALADLVRYVDDVWISYGAPAEVHGALSPSVEAIRRQALVHGMTLVSSPVRHMGSDRAADILRAHARRPRTALSTVRTGTTVERRTGGTTAWPPASTCTDGSRFSADAVDPRARTPGGRLARRRMPPSGHRCAQQPGRHRRARRSAGGRHGAPYERAVREQAHTIADTFDDPVRTFCMNPHGVVSVENYGDVVTVNGHSYADRKTEYTNFALLLTDFTQPFDDPITYGKSVARLANLLGGDIIVQRLGDLLAGHRSTAERLRRSTVPPRSPARPRATCVRAALPPPARHPRHARGARQAGAGRQRPRHAALRRRGQVLLGPPPARPRASDRNREPLRDRRRRRGHPGLVQASGLRECSPRDQPRLREAN